MKNVILFGMMILCFASWAYAVPNTFSAGEVVSASKMNANFAALETAIETAISEITVTTRVDGYNYGTSYGSTGSEVATATCAANEVLVGGSCSCITPAANFGTTNFGKVRYCDFVGGNGGAVVGACGADGLTHNVALYGPPITVYANCAVVTDMPAIMSMAPVGENPEITETRDKIDAAMDLINSQVK